jgi:hypothetical protein
MGVLFAQENQGGPEQRTPSPLSRNGSSNAQEEASAPPEKNERRIPDLDFHG